MPARDNCGSTSGAAQSANVISGCDTEGRVYTSTEQMWAAELRGDLYDPQEGWYGKALEYWKKTPATVDGVLGGMTHVHEADVKESKEFIDGLPDHATNRALDCGAGIGRITKFLLSHMYRVTDVLEPVPHMLEKAKDELAGLPVDKFILSSMQTAMFPPNTYDLIVIQWTAIYLTDEDFATFLKRCQTALTDNGYIFLKENCTTTEKFIVDKDDSSLTRSDTHYKQIFHRAGVSVVKEAMQQEWPSDLFAVKMRCLGKLHNDHGHNI